VTQPAESRQSPHATPHTPHTRPDNAQPRGAGTGTARMCGPDAPRPECCIGCNKASSSNQVTVRPPRCRHPHRVARAATSASLRPLSASRPTERGSGTPGPLRSETSTRTMPLPAMTTMVIVSPGRPERLCRRLLLKSSLTKIAASSPHGCPRPSTAPTNARATRARSARPASVTLSRTATAISAPALPGPPGPGKNPGTQRPRREIQARLGRERQAGTPRPRGPSVAVRGKANGYTHRPTGTKPVRYASVDPAT
jgi:hypothetical protein